MESFEVTGGARLAGDVAVTGAKNSVLKVRAAALLAEGTTTLANVPDIIDVPIMSEVLRGLGAEVSGHAPEVAITVPERIGQAGVVALLTSDSATTTCCRTRSVAATCSPSRYTR